MKRLTVIMLSVVSALLLASLGPTIWWFVWVRTHREFRFGDDLHRALGVLNRVRLAESQCQKAQGHFVDLRDLGPAGCGRLPETVSAGTDDGFSIAVSAASDHYTIRVHPVNTARLHSLYLDQTGTVHIGTRDWPAGPNSPLLIPRK